MIRPLLLATLIVLSGCDHGDHAIVRCHDTGTPFDAPGGKRTRLIFVSYKDTLFQTLTEDGERSFELPVHKCSVEHVR